MASAATVIERPNMGAPVIALGNTDPRAGTRWRSERFGSTIAPLPPLPRGGTVPTRRGGFALAVLCALGGRASADNNPLAAPPSPPPAATPAPAAPPSSVGQKESGIVAEIHLGSSLASLGGGLGFSVSY